MATQYSSLYNIQAGLNNGGAAKAAIGDINGRVRTLHFEHAFTGNVAAIADIIKLGQLPKDAMIVDSFISCVSTGTTGIFDFGYAASADGLEVADADAFGPVLDSGGQAVSQRMLGSYGGFMKRLAGKVDVQLVMTEATDSASGDIVKGYVQYVID